MQGADIGRPLPSPLARAGALGLLAGLTAVVALSAATNIKVLLRGVIPEAFWADRASPWALALVIALSASAVLRVRSGRNILLLVWIGIVAAIMALRELDLHALFNPKNISLLGLEPEHAVRFRVDWWIDAGTPSAVRFAWAGVGVLLGAVVVLPFAFARHPWPERLLRRDLFTVLYCSGIALMGIGYLLDDVVARHLISSRALRRTEELLELAGQLSHVAAMVTVCVRPRALDRAFRDRAHDCENPSPSAPRARADCRATSTVEPGPRKTHDSGSNDTSK